ncbi:MAG: ferredoxin [Myxococcota bacterium]
MRVRVDHDACAGHGRCYELAPEIFGEDERGHVRLLVETVPEGLEQKARVGAWNCPEHAIEIEDD